MSIYHVFLYLLLENWRHNELKRFNADMGVTKKKNALNIHRING